MTVAGPAAITRLQPDVVNRIAAGEVIQRPSSALKELLENALDAGATSITVTAKDGGSKILQIQDNGHGIREEDMPILCERHTTSKLCQFEDLQTLQTLGFRGEALASISFVSHVTITTQPASALHALRATYHDGVMDEPGAVPCASTPGTTILVEDMFYNIPLRKKSLKSSSEEHAAILDIVGRYAVYKAGVAFVCKRAGESRADLVTPLGATRLDNIRTLHGTAVAKNAVQLSFRRGDLSTSDPDADLSCSVEGYITGAGWTGKKSLFVLFINGRPVECSPLRRALEAAVSSVLQRPTKPFIFLDITLPSHHVDVNVHPTKKEVAFLHQDDLIIAIREEVEATLLASDHTRVFVQTQLPGVPTIDVAAPTQASSAAYRPDRLVRTDARALTLEAFLGSSQGVGAGQMRPDEVFSQVQESDEAAASQGSEEGATACEDVALAKSGLEHPPPARRPRLLQGGAATRAELQDGPMAFMPTALEIGGAWMGSEQRPEPRQGSSQPMATPSGRQLQRRAVRVGSGRSSEAGDSLLSIQALLRDVNAAAHPGLAEIMKNHTFVGMASPSCVLLQHGTRLYAADLPALLTDLAYQNALTGFGEFERIRLDPPPSAAQLLQIALTRKGPDALDPGAPGNLIQVLKNRAEMLADYFAIDITTDGCLASLPALLGNSVPPPDGLPAFALALAEDVDWHNEEACFDSLAQALGNLFGRHALDAAAAPLPSPPSPQDRPQWRAEHSLLPQLRARLVPGKARARDGTLRELTRLEQLYRVFERC